MIPALPLEILLPTKLSPPQPLTPWVLRPRVLALLGDVPASRLTLVVGPAGFGKSTLVAQWLYRHEELSTTPGGRPGRGPHLAPGHTQLKVAWLTLDEHDQDPLRFLAYVAGAVRTALPDALPTAVELLRAPSPPPLYVILQAFLLDLSTLPWGVILVLDDYHEVTAEPIHQAVAYLLRHLPATCRLVLTSRAAPPLPLSRLQAERQVTELRAADLRFTEVEAGAMLACLTGNAPEQEQLAGLLDQTEGWALALQMAALAQQSGARRGLSASEITRHITEYLANEVLMRQPQELQQALLALAIPERFCAELCAVLLGAPEDLVRAEHILEQLLRANLFVIPLDTAGRWYRFHHLFRELLLRRVHLSSAEHATARLHRQTAGWLADAGHTEEALRHYLAAGDEDAAAELVERQQLPIMSGQARLMGSWLNMLPPALIARRPGLTLIEAFRHCQNLNLLAAEACLQRLDAMLEAQGESALPWASFLGDRDGVKGELCFWQGRPHEVIASLERMRTRRPLSPLDGLLTPNLGLAYVGDGRYEEGIRLIEAQIAGASAEGAPGETIFQLTSLCGMHLLAGRLDALASVAERLEQRHSEGPGDYFVAYSRYTLGSAAYERGELSTAAEHFRSLVERKYYVAPKAYISSVAGLAAISVALGDRDSAMSYVAELESFARETGSLYARHQAAGCTVRVALAAGDVGAAFRAAQQIEPDIHLGTSVWFEAPRLSKVRALVAEGSPASLAEAEAELAGCLAQIEGMHNTRLLIAALAIQALLRAAERRHAEAEVVLELALTLAAPLGFVRTLADLGSPLVPLVRAVAARGLANAPLERLLGVMAPATARPRMKTPVAPQPAVPELLTRRESEVLGLLAERWTDQEIADHLVISLYTVRKHTATIYDKLSVGGRREAVAAALALGILAGALFHAVRLDTGRPAEAP